MQPPYKAREHIYDEIQVPLVGAAPVVIGVRKRQNQAFRTWSAVAAGVLLIGLVATVLTAGDLAGDDASIQSQAKTSESKAPRAAASLRQLLKEHDRRSVPSVPLMTLQRGRSMTFYDFISVIQQHKEYRKLSPATPQLNSKRGGGGGELFNQMSEEASQLNKWATSH